MLKMGQGEIQAIFRDKGGLTKGNASMSWQVSGQSKVLSGCRRHAKTGVGRYSVADSMTSRKCWNPGLVETSGPNSSMASQWAKNKTQSPCNGAAWCDLGHPATSLAHSAPIPPDFLCSLNARNTLLAKSACAWLSLCLESSCPRFSYVFHTHCFHVLAEKSVLQKGLFSPLYHKEHPSFCLLTIIYACPY